MGGEFSGEQQVADAGPPLPASCLRGLKKADWVKDSIVLTAAFLPDERTAENRQDGGAEVSVHWEDDSTVEQRALADARQAAHGLARLQRARIDWLNGVENCLAALLCERRKLETNPHHGNVVFRAGLGKTHVGMIAGALALASCHVPRT
jgi:hypothetical protein